MAHEIDILEAERAEPATDDARVPGEGVGRVRSAGEAVSGQVQHQHAMVARQRGRNLQPCAVGIAEAVEEHERATLTELLPVEVTTFDALEAHVFRSEDARSALYRRTPPRFALLLRGRGHMMAALRSAASPRATAPGDLAESAKEHGCAP